MNDEYEKIRPIHPFPARMASSIAMSELSRTPNKVLRVLDPMMGSGTTIVLSKFLGHRAFGFDLDPLAVILSQTWATSGSVEDLMKHGTDVLNDAKKHSQRTRACNEYPKGATEETKNFINFWFDSVARKQLTSLSVAIQRSDPSVRSFLWTALSRTIIVKSNGVSLAIDLSHSRPHRFYEKALTTPFEAFPNAIKRIVSCAPFVCTNEHTSARLHEPDVRIGDARCIPKKSNQFDLVLTSPPYLNAIDYIRCSKFALVWMGFSIEELRATRKESIGCEVGLAHDESEKLAELLNGIRARKKLPVPDRRILDRYVKDMNKVVFETARVLKDSGRAVFVLGDSRLKGVFISNSKIVERLAEQSNLRLVQKERRQLQAKRRYLPPPSSDSSGKSLQARMGYEVILRFERTKR